MATDPAQRVQRDLAYAIVDEVDSILIDEARTPLIISAPAEEPTDLYHEYARYAARLEEGPDYIVEEKYKSASLTEEGITKMQRLAGVKNIYDLEHAVEMHERGRPVLVGTVSVEKSERLSRMLDKRGIPHNVLNAKQHEREAAIVAEAGQSGAVTIATNMAGRGTDIVLGEGVADAGGLHIIGTERHESRRIDNQLRGRSGRQGDPGESRFFLSFEDDLMRVFGGERMQGIMDRLRVDEDTPLESRMVSRQIESAQSRVEGHNFDARRHVVEYDDVMNKQREVNYGERRKILEGTDTRANFLAMVEPVVTDEVPTFCEGRNREAWDMEGLWERMHQFAVALPPLAEVNIDSLGTTADDVAETITGELTALYEEKEQEYGAELLRQVEQSLMLQVIDNRWRAYLTQMDHLREGIGLQAYGQKDPLVEYKQAAFDSFQDLTEEIQREIVRFLLNVQITVEAPSPAPAGPDTPAAEPAQSAAQATAPAS